MKQKYYDTAEKQEKAVLVGIIMPHETEEQEREYLEELAFLVDTAGGETVKTFTQKMQRPERGNFCWHRKTGRNKSICSGRRDRYGCF